MSFTSRSNHSVLALAAAILLLIDGRCAFAESPSSRDPLPTLSLQPPSSLSNVLQLDDDAKPDTSPASIDSTRYFFGLLDNRSSYGKDFFPNSFLGPQFDKKTQLGIGYMHTQDSALIINSINSEFEWNPIGQLTIAAEFGWESVNFKNAFFGDFTIEGASSVTLAAYHPVFQYVSPDNFFDYTAVIRVDADIPTDTPISGSDLLLTPYLAHLLRLGDHVSIMAWTGAQFDITPHPANELLYGASLAYRITHDQLPLWFTDHLTPMLEINGTAAFSSRSESENLLIGVAGFEWSLNAIGPMHPHISIGYEFPIDQTSHDLLDWGIITQVFFEF